MQNCSWYAKLSTNSFNTISMGAKENSHNTLTGHWDRCKIPAISQTTFSNGFSWKINAWISLKISLKFVPGVRINNIPVLIQIMARCRPGDKPLSELIMVTQITSFMGPTWGPPGSCQPQMGPMLAPRTLLSGYLIDAHNAVYASFCLNWLITLGRSLSNGLFIGIRDPGEVLSST